MYMMVNSSIRNSTAFFKEHILVFARRRTTVCKIVVKTQNSFAATNFQTTKSKFECLESAVLSFVMVCVCYTNICIAKVI